MCAGASRLLLLPPGPRPPFGGRCPGGADEGAGEASCPQSLHVASRRTLTPTPLPEGEGLVGCCFSLRDHGPLFGGRCSAGADEGRAEPRALTLRRSLRAVPSPQPLSRGERGLGRVLAHACCDGRKQRACRGLADSSELALWEGLQSRRIAVCRSHWRSALPQEFHPQNENGPRKAARLWFDASAAYADRCSIAATLPRRSPRRLSRARRLRRSAGSSALTITPSKNASTCGRSRARKFSTVT
ncbi:hypothetical protein NB690_000353 [Xanthomonas sacchari]|nr:hypothetical protein [Xanthomonas sacchari]